MMIGCDLLVFNSSDSRIMILAISMTSPLDSLFSFGSPVIVFHDYYRISTTITPI